MVMYGKMWVERRYRGGIANTGDILIKSSSGGQQRILATASCIGVLLKLTGLQL